MAHGGGRAAIGKKPDRFSQAVARAVRTTGKGLRQVGNDHYKGYNREREDYLLRKGKAKNAGFRNTASGPFNTR